jgi:hypothetical protein
VKRDQQLEPSEYDYKFAEMAIDAQYAIYEETGKFPFQRQLERLTDDIRKIRQEQAGIPTSSLASERLIERLRKRKEIAK